MPVAAETRVRTLLGESLVDRVSEWTERLSNTDGQRTSVERLYAGDHWHVAKSALRVAPVGIRVRLWICSAGYGLLSPQSSVRSYGATFAPQHPDSVVPDGSQFRASDWWDALTKWTLTGTDHRSISGLAEEAKLNGDFLLVALSQSYLRAVGDDLSAASHLLGERLGILSAGTKASTSAMGAAGDATVTDRFLPAGARLRTLVGGAMQSLNVRVARQLIESADKWFNEPQQLRNLLSNWIETTPELARYDRDRSSDAAVKDFIRRELSADPRNTHTRLLRALRLSGRACEQSRFRDLFQSVSTAHESESSVREERRLS
jgi:hypothetical protein